jgi:hypothetical protein
MEALLSTYGIEFAPFKRMIELSSAVLAGGAALACYLKQESIEPGYEPNDLDIFLPGVQEPTRDDDERAIGAYRIRPLEAVAAELTAMGFNENDKFRGSSAQAGAYYSSIKKLQRVVSFNNAAGKEIQVIVVNTSNMRRYMKDNFDLSACISWWDSDTDTFKTADPYHTKQKMIYPMNPNLTDARLKARVEARCGKYAARGFTVIKKPSPVLKVRDNRGDDLGHVKFNDLMTTEGVPVRGFLRESVWNIILIVDKQFYAFDRQVLMGLMDKQKSPVDGRIGYVYDTPTGQSITTYAYWNLQYADYSIYELTPDYAVTAADQKVKSLFSLTAFTVRQWACGLPGEKMSPPARPLEKKDL